MGDRHQFRAKWHDYNEGIYFVTICTHNKRHIFGRIVGTRFIASVLGEVVKEHIEKLSKYYDDLEVWNYVIMPNHIHIVISIGTRFIASANTLSANKGCLKKPRHHEEITDYHHNSRLAVIVGSFKAGVTRSARTRLIASLPVWQSRFHEHIIRNQHAFDNIMDYINNNVLNWDKDCFYI